MVKYHFIKLKRLLLLTKIYFSFIDPMSVTQKIV